MVDTARRNNVARLRPPTAARLLLALLVVGLVFGSLDGSFGQAPEPPPVPLSAPPGPPRLSQVEAPPLVAPRFSFKVPAGAPLSDLLPTAPKAHLPNAPLAGDDLAKVPEVAFEAPGKLDRAEAIKHAAHTIFKINHLNDKEVDGFLKALIEKRTDLPGLPFAMGDACRTKGERSKHFAIAVATVRAAMKGAGPAPSALPPPLVSPTSMSSRPATRTDGSTVSFVVAVAPGGFVSARQAATDFWDRYQALCREQDASAARIDRAEREHMTTARIAALMQVLAPETPSMRLGLARYLSTVSHVEATKALARLVLFSPEAEVREMALEGLKVRRERDYTDVLMSGFRYPFPAVARRAADAVVQLERTDLLPRLVDVLDDSDPRAPQVRSVNKKRVPVVRELVRINHHRNCLLCHAPGNTGKVSPTALSAEVPNPHDPLPSESEGYRNTNPDLMVRVDVTYLRQDFSVLQPVQDANPWPEMQRFDFLVRARALSKDEAAVYRANLEKADAGKLSPYKRAALSALRELTGKDAEPTADAWRRLLSPPAKRAEVSLRR